MRDQKHAAAGFIAQPRNQFIKSGLAGKIDALHGFVQHHDIRLSRQRTRHQGALEFAAGKMGCLSFEKMRDANRLKRGSNVLFAQGAGQRQQTFHRKRQGAVDIDLLRNIADAQAGLVDHFAFIRLENAQRHLGGRAFARTIRPDQHDDLATFDLQIDIAHKPAPVAINTGVFQFNQRFPRLNVRNCILSRHCNRGFRCLHLHFAQSIFQRIIRRFGVFPSVFFGRRDTPYPDCEIILPMLSHRTAISG